MRVYSLIAAAIISPACGGRANVPCEQSANCNISGGGVCIAAPTGNMWCAYPDPACPSGYRYSDDDVGDGVSGQCVPEDTRSDGGIDAPPDTRPDSMPVVPGSWGKHIPGAGFESVGAVAVASDGSVFFAGSFDGTLDVGGGPLVASGTSDVFVAKFTASGQHVWSVRFGGSSSAGATELAVLSNGELAIAGTYRGMITFGTTTLTSVGGQDVFLARLTSNGGVQWTASAGTAGDESLHDMALDASGNIGVCGQINYGGGPPKSGSFFGTTLSGSSKAWIVRLTATGSASWGMVPAADGINSKCGLAMASNGDVVFVTVYNGNANVGGSTYTSTASSADILLARFRAADGAHVWSTSNGGSGNEGPNDVDVTGSSMSVVGYFSGTTSLGGGSLMSAGGDDAFVAKFDPTNGAHQFSTRFGGTAQDRAQHVSVRADGLVTVAGVFAETVSFGGTVLTSNGDFDPFVVDLDGTTGAITSVRSVGGVSRDEANDVVSTADSMVFAGQFASSIEVLGQTYTSMGALDGYVIRYKR